MALESRQRLQEDLSMVAEDHVVESVNRPSKKERLLERREERVWGGRRLEKGAGKKGREENKDHLDRDF